MTTRLEQIKARMEAASNLKGATWDGIKINEEDGYTHVPECSTLGDTLIMLSHDYEGDGEDCIFLQNAYSDLAALLRLAEAAERWEEAKSNYNDICEQHQLMNSGHNYSFDRWCGIEGEYDMPEIDIATDKADWEMTTMEGELCIAVRAFRERGGEG